MKLRELTPGLWQATHGFNNVFAVVDGEQTVLFDAAFKSAADDLMGALDDVPPVRHLVLTHWHSDHVGCAAAIKQKFDCPVSCHPLTAEKLSQGKWKEQLIRTPNLSGWIFWQLVAKKPWTRVPEVQDCELVEGDKLALTPSIQAEVHRWVGHCSGQLVFAFNLPSGQQTWVIGDIFLNIFGLREPFVHEDQVLTLRAIGELTAKIANGDWVCTGHGPAFQMTPGKRRKLERIASAQS